MVYGNKKYTLSSVTYSTVVSRDLVIICLIIAALNDLNVLVVDIENAYLTAPTDERLYAVLGPEFGEDSVRMRAK